MVTGAAHPAAEAAGVRAAPARPDAYPLWAFPLADMVTARGGTAPSCSSLGYPPRLSGSELRYRRALGIRRYSRFCEDSIRQLGRPDHNLGPVAAEQVTSVFKR